MMKSLATAALVCALAALGAPMAVYAQSVLIQSCKLPSGVTVVHNGRCEDLAQARADDFSRPQALGAATAPRAAGAAPEGIGLSRDAFFAAINGTLIAECDKPKSKLACAAKTPDVCRRTMPQVAAVCEKNLKGQMPAALDSKEDVERWAKQLGQCAGNQFFVIAGPANLDITGCKSTAAGESDDVGSSLMSLLRKARVRR